jgi:hypothetical protein
MMTKETVNSYATRNNQKLHNRSMFTSTKRTASPSFRPNKDALGSTPYNKRHAVYVKQELLG